MGTREDSLKVGALIDGLDWLQDNVPGCGSLWSDIGDLRDDALELIGRVNELAQTDYPDLWHDWDRAVAEIVASWGDA